MITALNRVCIAFAVAIGWRRTPPLLITGKRFMLQKLRSTISQTVYWLPWGPSYGDESWPSTSQGPSDSYFKPAWYLVERYRKLDNFFRSSSEERLCPMHLPSASPYKLSSELLTWEFHLLLNCGRYYCNAICPAALILLLVSKRIL